MHFNSGTSRQGTALLVVLAGLSLGAAPTMVLAQDAAGTITGDSSSTVTVPAPTPDATANDIVTLDKTGEAASAYSFSATREEGATVLRGDVPTAEDKDRLGAGANTDATALEVAPGAPGIFADAVAFGMKALSHLQSGKFTLKGTVATLHGTAVSQDDYDQLHALLGTGVPDGLVLARADVAAPAASAGNEQGAASDAKSPDAGVTASSAGSADVTAKAAPAGEAVASGNAKTPQDSGMASADSSTTNGATGTGDAVTKDVTASQPASAAGSATAQAELPAEPAAPQAVPYLWSIEKSAKGSFAIAGDVPTANLQQAIAEEAGQVESDTSKVADGAPDSFGSDAQAAVAALGSLDQGRAAYSGTEWSLTGQTADAAGRDAALAALDAAATPVEGWTIDIQVVAAGAATPKVKPAENTAPEATGQPASQPQASEAAPAGQEAAGTSDAPKAKTEAQATPAPETAAQPVPQAAATEAKTGPSEPAASGAATSAKSTSEGQAEAKTKTPLSPEPKQAESAPAQSETPAVAPAPEVATAVKAEPKPEPTKPATPPPAYTFAATRNADGAVALEGMVPSDTARQVIATVAGDKVDNKLDIATAGEPDHFVVDVLAGLNALSALENGKLSLDAGTWTLSGKAYDKSVLQGIRDKIAALPDGAGWKTDIALPPPIEICRRQVAALSDKNAILFNPGSTHVTANSKAAIDEFAVDLAECPNAPIYVEGHTDSNGAAKYNMALSVSRAEAVVKELAARGIDPKRLYAVGYGETLPVASNKTAAGRARNRRIVITIPDKAE